MPQDRVSNYEYATIGGFRQLENIGSLYTPQEEAQDHNYLKDRPGQLLRDIHQKVPVLIEGGVVSQGTGSSLNITAGVGYVEFQVECPGDFEVQDPPTTVFRDIVTRVVWTAQTDYAVTDPGGATHYVKLKYKLDDEYDRTRFYQQDTSLPTTYYYQQKDSFEIVVDAVAPTDYELCLATFTGTPPYTITPYTAHRSIIFIDSATPELDIRGKVINLNSLGDTAGSIGSRINFIGDSESIVGYMGVDSSDNSLLTLKAPTGNILTLDCDIADSTLNIEADSAINQDLTNDADVDFNSFTVATDSYLDKADSTAIYAHFRNSTATSGFAVGIDDSENAVLNNQENTDMIFETNDLERLRITSNGYIIPTSINENTFFGENSSLSITTGTGNSCFGHNAGDAITEGLYNSCFGQSSGSAITTGDFNACFGTLCGDAITDGNSNSCLGHNAGGWITTGSYNSCIGSGSGSSVTTASNVIAIGYNFSAGNVTNTCWIDNIYGVTTTGGIAVYCNSNGQLGTATSSIRHKENLKESNIESSKIYDLKLYNFNYKDENKTESIGYTAEDLEDIFPEFVVKITKEKAFSTKEKKYEGKDKNELIPDAIDYNKLIFPIIEEMKKLKQRLDIIENK